MIRIDVRKLVLVAIFILCLTPAMAFADGPSSEAVFDDWGKFVLGMVGGIASHELGHVLVARAYGYSVGHDGLSLKYAPAFRSSSDRLRVASAGFQGQWLAAETAFSIDDRGSLGNGVICGHIASSFAYLLVLKNHPNGDTVGIATSSGLSVDQVAGLAVLPAMLDTWRLFGSDIPRWVPGLSLMLKGTGMSAVWMF